MGFLETGDRGAFGAEKLTKTALFATPQMFCDLYGLEPGQEQAPHAHEGATKFYFVLEGSATFTVGPERRTLGPGGLAWAEPGEAHGVANESERRVLLLVAMAPNPGPARPRA